MPVLELEALEAFIVCHLLNGLDHQFSHRDFCHFLLGDYSSRIEVH